MYTFILECHHNGIITQLDRMESESRTMPYDMADINEYGLSMESLYGNGNFQLYIVRIDRTYDNINCIWG